MSQNDIFAEAPPLRRPWMVEDRRVESKPGEPHHLHLAITLEEDLRHLPGL